MLGWKESESGKIKKYYINEIVKNIECLMVGGL